MSEVTEFEGGMNPADLQFLTPEDYFLNEIKLNARIADSYGGTSKVFVGEIIGRREVLKELCLYVTITFPVSDTDFKGTQQVEGYLKLSSLVELAAVAKLCNQGKTLVIDKETKEIIEVRTW